MDENTQNSSDRNNLASRATPVQRPPIQWPVRATNPTDNQRAAEIARLRVSREYDQPVNAPPQAQQATHQASKPEVTNDANPQQYNWDQYHNAWQQYYHQYFYRYYAGWWQQQKHQIESSAQQAAEQQHRLATTPNSQVTENEQQKVAKELRNKIRSTVETQAKKVQRSSHFKPALAALSVASIFLLFNYNQVIIGMVKQYIAPGSVATTPVIVESNANAQVGKEPKIIIPKIGVDAPVVYDEPKVDEQSYQAALERGVVRLGNTANPGTKGNIVIGGHSSNNVFNPGKYKYVFVNLKRLQVDDVFYLNYNGTRYTYKITVANKIVSPKDVSVLAQTDQPTVTLFTCDPPGTDTNRLIVQATQIDPSPSKATANQNQSTPVNSTNPLPSVAPSIWDRIF